MDDTHQLNMHSAREDFRRARRRAALQAVMERLTGRSEALLSFEEVKQRLQVTGVSDRGLQEVPIGAIVGSVGRYTDFTRSFLPKRASDEERWAGVMVAMMEKGRFEPIQLYQVGDAYFVLDGNHRVSIARHLGWEQIAAYVTRIDTVLSLSPDESLDELILKAERASFLERSELAQTRPTATLEATLPGRYPLLEEEIEHVQEMLAAERGETVPFSEAAVHWYDTIYLPVARVIRARGLLRDFPERSEADLYLWTSRHRERLEQHLAWAVDEESAAADLAERGSQQPERIVGRVGQRLRESLLPDEFEAGPPPGAWRRERVEGRDASAPLFRDILLPLSGEEPSWQALEQALVIARREQGRLLALHVVPSAEHEAGLGPQVVRRQLAERLAGREIEGELVVRVGKVVPQLCSYARWFDLVVISLRYPPGAQPLARLQSSWRRILHRCPRPVLVVPGEATALRSALLAYDGSPKSEEALFIATYLAKQWQIPLVVVSVLDGSRVTEKSVQKVRAYLAQHGVEAHFEHPALPPAEAILECANQHESELILMGGYGLNAVGEVILGSTVNQLLRETSRPLLICR